MGETTSDRTMSEEVEDLTAENLRLVAENEGLNVALGRRGRIGQATGILMERHKITDQEAFAMLVESSQRQNVKLFTLAEHLAGTGELL